VQVVSEGNDREQKGQDADHRNRFHPRGVPWISPRHAPAKSPQPNGGHGDCEPDKIKNRLHQFTLTPFKAMLLLAASTGKGNRLGSSVVYNGAQSSGNLSRLVFMWRFTQQRLCRGESGDSLRAMNGGISLTTSRGEKHNGLLQQVWH
jgi:hypothetical protein